MDIDYALIADHADIVGGKLYLMGGGWDTFSAATLPAQVRLAVVVGVRIGWDETNRPVPVIVTVEDDDGATLVRIEGQVNVGRPPTLPPGATQLAQMAANVPVNIAKAGGGRCRRGGEEPALPHPGRRGFGSEKLKPVTVEPARYRRSPSRVGPGLLP
jgi:hypothetical protein